MSANYHSSLVDQKTSRSRLDISLHCFQTFLELIRYRLGPWTSRLASVVLVARWNSAYLLFNSGGAYNKERGTSDILVGLQSLAALSDLSDCTYVLHFVELNNRSEKNPWSLRQALTYHRHSSALIRLFIGLSKSMSSIVQEHIILEIRSPRKTNFHHI